MPRPPRIRLDNVPLHIVQRGHNRSPCFFQDADYRLYLNCLHEAACHTQCRVHAYVLMTNHVHLLLTPTSAESVSRLFVQLGSRFVRHINRRYERTGSLWDSRYKCSVIDSDAYLLACQRYIELNPVRAGIVSDPALYRWSSYRANALGQPARELTPHPVFRALGPSDRERQASYRQLFQSTLHDEAIDDIRHALNRNRPLGNARFRGEIERVTGQSMARTPGRPRLQSSRPVDGATSDPIST